MVSQMFCVYPHPPEMMEIQEYVLCFLVLDLAINCILVTTEDVPLNYSILYYLLLHKENGY